MTDPATIIRDRYVAGDGAVPMTGVQALARLAFDLRRADQRAGRRTAGFISGYEGSPLGGYDLELQRQQALLDELDIVFRPGVNEELAATAVQGTQLAAASPDARVAGVTGIWYGKSPGLDRATDALRHGNLMGTHPLGGAIAAVGDDPAAKSSTVPGASEFLLADLGMPVLYPADPQDVLDLGLHAVAMSRASGLWTGLKIVTGVADGTSNVRVGPDRVVPATVTGPDGRPFAHTVTAVMLQPHLSRLERSREGIRRDMAVRYAAASGLNRIIRFGPGGPAQPGEQGGPGDARIGIVAAGRTYLEVRHALGTLGLDDAELGRRGVRLLRLAMIHPLIPAEVARFADGLDEIIVVEEKRPFVESALRAELYGRAGAPRITGKRDPAGRSLFGTDGMLTVDAIADGLAGRLAAIGGFPALEGARERRGSASLTRPGSPPRAPLPITPVSAPRTPYFCSGCPHNSSTKVPDGSLVGAGIGCHALVLLVGSGEVGEVTGLTQMGGEGAQWNGMAPFLNRAHLLQNLGDGTFHHSGSLAIRAAVASGVNITYKILYNSAVAMTGGQQPAGGMSVGAMARTLLAEGVARVIVTTEDPGRYRRRGLGRDLPRGVQVRPRDRLIEAQETLARTPGVTVLIHDQECATELRRKRKRGLAPVPRERVVINERICEGCGDCGHTSNCLSVQPVETEFGRKTRIDQSSCNVDLSCLDGDCPSFMTVRLPDKAGDTRRAGAGGEAAAALGRDLPDPVPRADLALRPHRTRVAGIGGTGVVTVSQILSAAATFAGYDVAALDQTGLAQKGGAVISDVIIGGRAEHGNGLAAGECDLYLGCDLLVAAEDANLTVADPGRTVAVVSTDVVPTGAMVTDATSPAPDTGALSQRIAAATRAADAVFTEARRTCAALFGADHFANIFLLGCAYQGGNLPLPATAIESAITANGVAVPLNLAAFRRGRQAVCDSAGLAAALGAARGGPGRATAAPDGPEVTDAAVAEVAESAGLIGAPAGSGLYRLAASRIRDLIAYQDAGYARRYAETVARVHQREQAVRAGQTELSETVARYLYKLMAYKDEYEVARLALSPAAGAAVEEQFGPGARISYRLHPPVLRALGLRHKVSLGPWFRPAFGVLRSMRRLRGTRLDPFGRTEVRRTERALIGEYLHSIDVIVGALSEETYKDCVDLAALPDEVRGYEGIKLASVRRYRENAADLKKSLVS